MKREKKNKVKTIDCYQANIRLLIFPDPRPIKKITQKNKNTNGGCVYGGYYFPYAANIFTSRNKTVPTKLMKNIIFLLQTLFNFYQLLVQDFMNKKYFPFSRAKRPVSAATRKIKRIRKKNAHNKIHNFLTTIIFIFPEVRRFIIILPTRLK